MLMTNTNLKSLKLESCQFLGNNSDAIFVGLSKHKALENLYLGSINVSSEGFKSFPGLIKDTNI